MNNSHVQKGIILAGGNGTRLQPMTGVICKQLLPIYDKPMIYYPLSLLMRFGIREILLISTPNDIPRFQSLFGDGSFLGLKISYMVQEKPEGIAQAFILGQDFIGSDRVALILGDNIFYGVETLLRAVKNFDRGALVFGSPVKDPQRYGVIGFDNDGAVNSIIEKPENPRSNYAVTGLYLYDCEVISIASSLTPSQRGELEITDINRIYLERKQLQVVRLDRNITWLDTGTYDSMLDAANFIAAIEKRHGQKIACIEEIAYREGFINTDQMQKIISDMTPNSYQKYLIRVLEEVEGEGG